MISFLMNHKLITIITGLVVAGAVGYGLTSGSGSSSSSLITSETVGEQGADGDLVSTLLALRAVKLDATLFTDPAFAGLKDFSTQNVPEPIGRPNPFAGLGSSVAPTDTTTKGAQMFSPASTTVPTKTNTKTKTH